MVVRVSVLPIYVLHAVVLGEASVHKAEIAAQEIDDKGEAAACKSRAIGNAVATLKGKEFCIKLSYGLGFSKLPERFSHIHGPAKIGENGPVVFTLSKDTLKTDCFKLKNKKRILPILI